MNTKDHKVYLKEFKTYSKEITASKEATQEFLVRTGINTPTGRLTKAYSPQTTPNSNKK
jgi:hypothetical protein